MNYPYRIRMSDTDAAGRIYFAAAMDIAHASFEHLMSSIGHDLITMIRSGTFILPVVHAEADYRAPLQLGDLISVETKVKSIGKGSVTFIHDLIAENGKKCITVTITHAAVSKKQGKAIHVPAALRKALLQVQ